jgi:hypothetical protein
MLYVVATPEHGVAEPVIVPGAVMDPLIVTANVAAVDVPHAFVAVTVTLPDVALAVVEMLVVVEVPVQPPGKVHVYEVAPATAAILYVLADPEHTVVFPVIVPGVAGAEPGVTAKVLAVEVPHVLVAVTLTLPAVALGVAEILVVVEVPVQPPGKVHVYEVAPATAAILYVVATPEHGVAEPVIVPGVAGVEDGVTAKVLAGELPQILLATTLTLPAVALGVTVMLVVVEVPVQPPGKVQV